MNSMKQSKGFALIELIVVVSILGILLAIAVLNATGIIGNARDEADLASARTILTAIQMSESKTSGSSISEADVNAHLDLEVKLVTMATIPDSGWSIVKDGDDWKIFNNSNLIYP